MIGWKEFELEVMRDGADNFVVICSIENIDPMGVHTGDSITVAPALTLTDKEYQRMRDAARRIIRRVGVETGGSNIQFAINPANGRIVVIEMNPRVSRSSALASKATGFPDREDRRQARARLHASTRSPTTSRALTPASFEPTIDYVVVKVPRWAFEKFPQADRTLTTQMKSVGEAMAIGRTFKEAFLKAFRSLELGRERTAVRPAGARGRRRCRRRKTTARCSGELGIPNDRRMWAIFRALERGWTVEEIHELTHIDPWFLTQFQQIVELRRVGDAGRAARHVRRPAAHAQARRLRRSRSRRACSASTRTAMRGARARAGLVAGLQADRHLRRRVRVVHAVHVRHATSRSARRIRRRGRRSSSSAAARTASARASSSTTAAVTPPSRCATRASRR